MAGPPLFRGGEELKNPPWIHRLRGWNAKHICRLIEFED
jgi:hypothetical protein